jgi:phosphoribosylaminoimidazolecarboxamide formyltransferase/IMP cyclohydrolase
LGIPCHSIESITGFPSILGGRVKTLHPLVFGAILGKRDDVAHQQDMQQFGIPQFDLVMVDLYPFEETVRSMAAQAIIDESPIIEKIDIGGPSMIRAAAKNHRDVTVVASRNEYPYLLNLLHAQQAATTLEQRRALAIRAFDVCTAYDMAISNYFHQQAFPSPFGTMSQSLRYGENPHQVAEFHGDLTDLFVQRHGKPLSYNNLVDVDAAIQLIREFDQTVFAIIKHTNVCGIAQGETTQQAWTKALAGDPESAFGGVLICNAPLDAATASMISDLFFEVLIAPAFEEEAFQLLSVKKNRIVLELKELALSLQMYRSVLNGLLVQEVDQGNFNEWKDVGGRSCSQDETDDLQFANLVCKHLKSNAIALVKNKQLIGKGCGQTSRIDALRQALEKARQFGFDLTDAVLASDAFFPFDDCVRMAHAAGITAFIQPGGSVRDEDSIRYCTDHKLAMVLTGMRHFKH